MAVLRQPLLLLLLLGAVAFSGVPGFDLVWDDRHFLLYSGTLTHGSPVALFSSGFGLDGAGSGYYRPLVTLTFFLEHRLFGASPSGYHVMNVLYHLAAALALVWAGARLLGRREAAWLAGLVFVLHPIHTESVAFVSGRTDILATLFFLLAVGCYMRWAGGRPPWALPALLCFALALLAKEPAIALPAVLLAWELTLARAERGAAAPARIAARLLPFVLMAAAYLGVRQWALGSMPGLPAGQESLAARTAAGAEALGRYLLLLVAPYPPTPDIVLDPATWSSRATAAGLASLLLVGTGAVLAWRHSRLPAFLTLWFLLTLLPATPFVPWGPVQMAERFLYLPSAAFALCLGWGGGRWLPSRAALHGQLAARQGLAACAAAALFLLALGLTLYRNEDWRDSERLFTRMASSSPHSWKAAVNLGHVYQQRDDLLLAAAEFRRALALRPDLPSALMGLAVVESRLGIHGEAIRLGRRAQAAAPGSDLMDLQLALIHSNAGDHAAAAERFAEAVRKGPRRPDARFHLALELARAGREAEARAVLRDAEAFSRSLGLPPSAAGSAADLARARLRETPTP
ncbi:MAG: tetratricopeptide repeat protein [Candidatus Rokubacteria bacterium]|nr:tetratricopeptide repeat protein [Candidatus Rokubacteria bacterium]